MPEQIDPAAAAFATNPFATSVTVRFGDCDPAGIVFYPRYFEMFNNLVEEWWASGLGTSFRELIMERGLGLPTVSVQADFLATSTLGDILTAQLSVLKLGNSSVTVMIRLSGAGGDERVRARLVLVLMDLKKAGPTRIPDPLRERIAQFLRP
jgi:4-hydroxybenzoyl-CoA thioesterase